MTVEAAVTKLYYLLSMNYDLETVKKLMGTDLRGEMSPPQSGKGTA
jgi:L-asparaginase/Glu-tRNA(Gln) amidotransferase subunit D